MHQGERRRRHPALLRSRVQGLDGLPGPGNHRRRPSAQDFALAVAIVGVLMAAASAAGQASGGRSRYFQLMLAGFGLHAVGHVASAMGARGYTPGVVTAPLVAAPFAAWAVRQLKAAGTWKRLCARDIVPGTTLALAVLAGAHALARALNRAQHHST